MHYCGIIKTSLVAGVLFASSALAYSIQMTEPSADRAYHKPFQSIEVSAVAEGLPQGYTTAILLNGKVVADGTTASIATAGLDPNSYQLSAIIMNEKAQTVAKDERTIYVIQKATLAHKKQNAIKARQAYDNLPWYQKALIGINPNVQAPQDVNEQTPTWQIK